jgi:hypothetical protein
MGANTSAPEVHTTTNLVMVPTPLPPVAYRDDPSLSLSARNGGGLKKGVVQRSFEGRIILDSDPVEATKYAQLEYISESHWGDKDSRMVFWAKGCKIEGALGLGMVSQTSPDPEQWVWSAYRVMDVRVDVQMALRIAKETFERL